MGRTPRVIFKDQTYEIVIRARSGLPLPPTRSTNAIIEGVMARAQRDDKVELSNYCWMANHSHLLTIPKQGQPQQFVNFYGETQKKLTDSVRRITGRASLRLWEGRATTIMLAELQDVIGRLIYIFTNPAAAGLCDSIDEYPGVSSWQAFCTCEANVDAEVVTKAYWFPVDSLPELPDNHILEPWEDSDFLEAMLASGKKVEHDLVVKPFIWLKQFGITEPEEIEEIRKGVIAGVREREAQLKALREAEEKTTIGADALRRTPYMKPHEPSKKGNKIFLICKDKKRRLEVLGKFRAIIDRGRDIYQLLKEGCKDILWPDGLFIPWLPPRECCCLE